MGRLSGYSFGHVKVGDRTIVRDLILFEEELLCPWVRREGHRLVLQDLEWLLGRHPDLIIVGTGAFGSLRIPEDTVQALARKGISLLRFKTAEAVKEYGVRAERGERVACCLHLTC